MRKSSIQIQAEALLDRVAIATQGQAIKLRDEERHAIWEELMTRRQKLEDLLEQEVADLEAHGHHVSALERVMLDWENYSDPDL